MTQQPSEPRTEAGKRLPRILEARYGTASDKGAERNKWAADIEVEARTDLVAKIEKAVRSAEGHPHAESGGGSRYWIDRAAVLAAIHSVAQETTDAV